MLTFQGVLDVLGLMMFDVYFPKKHHNQLTSWHNLAILPRKISNADGPAKL